MCLDVKPKAEKLLQKSQSVIKSYDAKDDDNLRVAIKTIMRMCSSAVKAINITINDVMSSIDIIYTIDGMMKRQASAIRRILANKHITLTESYGFLEQYLAYL